MKLLVFADSHGARKNIVEAIKRSGAGVELVLFLGDGLNDLEYARSCFPELSFFEVRGNCDLFAGDIPKQAVLDLDGAKLLVTHGDKYNVKYGLTTITYSTAELEADGAFFGHTHQPLEKCEYVADRRIQLFNPGSIAQGSYGVVNIVKGVIITNIINLFA